MALKDDLIKIIPREIGGSIAASRFDFQKDWSLCRLLELHLSGQDYLLVFEYYEDLIELNSENNPTKISFYQIKTTGKNHWTLNELLKVEDSKKLSFLGKLYVNKINFPSTTESLNFVSNAPYKIKKTGEKKDGKYLDICISECDKYEIEKISKKLIEEHSLKKTPEFSEVTFLKNAGIYLQDSATYTLGRLTKFLEKKAPDKTFRPDLIYKSIFDEIGRRSSIIIEQNDFEKIKNVKGIGRSAFEDILKSIGFDSDFDSRWSLVFQTLITEKEDPRDIEELKRNWKKLEINLMDKSNDNHQKLCSFVAKIVKIIIGKGKLRLSLSILMNKALIDYKKDNPPKEFKIYDDFYIKIMSLWCFYEQKL